MYVFSLSYSPLTFTRTQVHLHTQRHTHAHRHIHTHTHKHIKRKPTIGQTADLQNFVDFSSHCFARTNLLQKENPKTFPKTKLYNKICEGKKKQVLQINADTQTTLAELQSIIVALRELEQQNQLTIQVPTC